MSDVTRLLESIDEGNEQATERLLPLVYHELRRLARARLAQENRDTALQPTELVHEAYLRLVGGTEINWSGRGHFFGAAAEAMRRILIDRARRRMTTKHGAGRHRIDLHGDEMVAPDPIDNKLLRLDQALKKFEEFDPKRSKLVKLRYFAGLSNREAAQAIRVSPATADRYWSYAKAWLQKEMQSDGWE